MEIRYYPSSAVERAMKVQEVILRAIEGRLKWYQAAEILGISDRQMRRWKGRYEKWGYDGLFDRRRQQPSPKCVPLEVVQQVLTLYRERSFGRTMEPATGMWNHVKEAKNQGLRPGAPPPPGLFVRLKGRRHRGRRRNHWPRTCRIWALAPC